MLVNVPVYSTQNNTHFVNIYAESDDGTFRRTQNEPLRLLRDDIAGISMPQGELVSQQYDRHNRQWASATVTYHYGRPQSFYQFLREKVAQNKFFVFSKPALSGHLIRFDVHELKFKSSMSQRKLGILKEKYLEALDLWSREEHEKRLAQQEMLRKDSLEHAKTQKIKLVKVHPQDRRTPANINPDNPGRRRSDRLSYSTGTESGMDDKVVVFSNGDEDTVRLMRQGPSGALKRSPVKPVHPSKNQVDGKNKDSNPFGRKPVTRSSHFLRRFLFHDH